MAESFVDHPNAAVRGLAAGQWTAEEFREYLRVVGTPLIDAAPEAPEQIGPEVGSRTAEAVPGDAALSPEGAALAPDGVREASAVQRVAVTFVRELQPDAAAVGAAGTEAAETRLVTLIDRALPPRGAFASVPGTDFLVQTLELPADLRFTYLLGEVAADGSRRRVRDLYNPRTGDPKLGGSVAVLPQAARVEVEPDLDSTASEAASSFDAPSSYGARPSYGSPSASGAQQAPAAGEGAENADAASRVTALRFASDLLGHERDVWVSVPPGWRADGGPYPYVIVFDGHAAHGAPAVRDRLAAAGTARPCVVVLVDEAGRRDDELTGNPLFTRALVEELVPRLRTEFALSADPRDAALSGKSFGGLCAGWTALQAPTVFGNAIMQSPSAWFHPDLTNGSGGGPTSAGTGGSGGATASGPRESVPPEQAYPVPLLIDAFSHADRVPVRLYQECGTLEFGPPPAQIWQNDANRWLHRVLDARGYDTVYHEFRGGHDAAWWDVTWERALAWAFPAGGRVRGSAA